MAFFRCRFANVFLCLILFWLCTSPFYVGVFADSGKDLDDEIYLDAEEEKEVVVQTPSPKDDYNDEEEFIGKEPVETKPLEKPKEPAPKSQLPPPRTNYYLEIGYICFIVFYVINVFIGKRKNEQIAMAWAKTISPILTSNFSKVGDKGENIGVIKESHYVFKLKATGRINCIGMQASIELQKRHDLISMLLSLFMKSEDKLTLDILMNEDAMDTFVFAILKKREALKIKKRTRDLLLHTGGISRVDELPNSLCVLTEADELIDIFLTPAVLTTLNNNEHMIEKIHFSDQGIVTSKYKKSLQFVFKLPTEQEMDKIAILVKMAIHYIDLIARTSLSKQAKQKATATRNKAMESALKEEHERRQEAAQQRKLEKKQKEKIELEKLSPEEQRKREEKNYKRELKKKQPKFKVSFG